MNADGQRGHAGLVPLTHHGRSFEMSRLLRAAASGSQDQRTAQARRFLDVFRAEVVPHLSSEEATLGLLAASDRHGRRLMSWITTDRHRLSGLVLQLEQEIDSGEVRAITAARTANALDSYLVFEETHLRRLMLQAVLAGLLRGTAAREGDLG